MAMPNRTSVHIQTSFVMKIRKSCVILINEADMIPAGNAEKEILNIFLQSTDMFVIMIEH